MNPIATIFYALWCLLCGGCSGAVWGTILTVWECPRGQMRVGHVTFCYPCRVRCQPCQVEGVSISTFSAFIHKILYSTQQPSAGSLEFAVVLTRHVSNIWQCLKWRTQYWDKQDGKHRYHLGHPYGRGAMPSPSPCRLWFWQHCIQAIKQV